MPILCEQNTPAQKTKTGALWTMVGSIFLFLIFTLLWAISYLRNKLCQKGLQFCTDEETCDGARQLCNGVEVQLEAKCRLTCKGREEDYKKDCYNQLCIQEGCKEECAKKNEL